MVAPRLVLASASPARRRLLENAGIPAIVYPSDFNEDLIQLTQPGELVQTLSVRKAETVAERFVGDSDPPLLVLGCDSVLALHGEIYGKPADKSEAIARWQQMRGQVGELYTGHTLIAVGQQPPLVRTQVTRVYFAEASDRQITAYVNTGEPLNCAGCFALEGKGSLLIEKLEGCHTNVIGLSMPLLRSMLAELGFDAIDFWPL